jgi:hypothetical protein
MKKGCFIKIIIVLTIFVAAGLFIIQNYKGKIKDFVFSKSKKTIKTLLINDFNKKLSHIKNSPEKDSLEAYMNVYFDKNFNKTKTFDEISERKGDKILSSLAEVLKDSVITKSDVERIKELINKK